MGRRRQIKDTYREHSFSKLRANGPEALHHGLLVLDEVGHQAHLPLAIQLGVTLVDELRQNVRSGLIRKGFFLTIFELLPQVLGLVLELLGHLLTHRRRHSIFDDLGGPPAALRADLEQVCRNTFLSYRSQSGVAGSQEGSPQLSSFKELT